MIYNAPTWVNGSTPAINAQRLQTLCDAVEQDGIEIQTLQQQQANPYTYKGTVASTSALPGSGNTVNDTYYVESEECLYTWNGSAWGQSSVSGLDYQAELTQITTDIGTLSNLTTTDKSSLVGAVNEVDGNVGDISSLTTTDKTSVVGAVNELVTDVGEINDTLDVHEAQILAAFPQETVTDVPVADFSDGADGLPVKDMVIDITPVQAGTGDPSPDNVRPISGWTGANLVVSPTQDAQDGTTVSISWQTEAGTVYGGTLDVTTGLLTVISRFSEYTGASSESWSASTTQESNARYFYIKVGAYGYVTNGSAGKYANKYTYGTITDSTTGTNIFAVVNSNGRNAAILQVRPVGSSTMTLSDFKSSLAGSPLQVVFPRSSPAATYQLTPTEIKTLLGANNIWADTGNVNSLTYRADPQRYVDNRINATKGIIAGVEVAMTATKNYVVGDLLIVGDSLYTVTVNIANGGSITPGTNVTATTVAEQLLALANV